MAKAMDEKTRMFVDLCTTTTTTTKDTPLYYFSSHPSTVPYLKCQNQNMKKKTPKMTIQKQKNRLTYNLMTDPRVKRGTYTMDPGDTVEFNDTIYYPCFDMVKKDPVCQINLARWKKCTNAGRKSIKVKSKKHVFDNNNNASEYMKSVDVPRTSLPASNNTSSSQTQTDSFYELLEEEETYLGVGIQTEEVTSLDYSLLGVLMMRHGMSGDSKETQMEPGDLFYFDAEVVPIVDNVVSAVIEQALSEVLEEEELDALLRQQRAYEYLRKGELQRLKRLRKRQQEYVEASSALITQEKETAAKAREAGETVSAMTFTKTYFTDFVKNVVEMVRAGGDLESKVAHNEVDMFLDTTEKKVLQQVNLNTVARALLDDIIQTVSNVREEGEV